MTYQENYQNGSTLLNYQLTFVMSWSQWMKKQKKMPSIPTFEFGTAGMRGLIGAGTNRINIYVVRQATEGWLN